MLTVCNKLYFIMDYSNITLSRCHQRVRWRFFDNRPPFHQEVPQARDPRTTPRVPSSEDTDRSLELHIVCQNSRRRAHFLRYGQEVIENRGRAEGENVTREEYGAATKTIKTAKE